MCFFFISQENRDKITAENEKKVIPKEIQIIQQILMAHYKFHWMHSVCQNLESLNTKSTLNCRSRP